MKKTIQISKIKTTFFVRLKLDQARVDFLTDLYNSDNVLGSILSHEQ